MTAYERLRRRAFGAVRDPGAGYALLLRCGMRVWIRTWASALLEPAPPARTCREGRGADVLPDLLPPAVEAELVHVLAELILSSAREPEAARS